ncbi:MAG: hypothetical protein LBV03_02175 [Fusobacteriales bacterium]|jgi:hypothetical protein|nr:hypothetical protein [Fusobacteriales bacterium]
MDINIKGGDLGIASGAIRNEGIKEPVHINFIELSRVYTEIWTLSLGKMILSLYI